MKLSRLFTKDTITENSFRDMIKHAGKAFKGIKRRPNADQLRIQKIVEEVFPEVWADYHKYPKAQKRLEAYKVGSFQQHVPELSKIKDPQQLRHEIKKLFKSRADRVLWQSQDPRRAYKTLGLDPPD